MDHTTALAYLADHVDTEALVMGRPRAPSLERMVVLADLLGGPQLAQPVVHLTGTNGKGSTTRMVSALLAAHGLTVGAYTSPDLQSVNERLARNAEPIDDESLGEAISAVAAVEAISGVRPTRFEILTLAAYWWFADTAVDAAVIEVGMAGTYDATNVAEAQVAVVTNVGLDHTEVLGPTRADIAREKAGIVKPGSTLVLGETEPELVAIFNDAGAERTWVRDVDFGLHSNQVAVGGRVLDLYTPSGPHRDVFLPLHGAHQGDNAALAVAATEAFFNRALDTELVADALGGIEVPGRFEIVGRNPLVILDGAHNPDGAATVAATLDDFSVVGERILVVGMNKGRDPSDMLEALDAGAARLVLATAPDWPRAIPATEVAEAARKLGVEAEVVPTVTDAVARALALATGDDVVIVTGSLYVVGEARASILGG